MKQILYGIKDQYDAIIIDCMPSLGMITINALAASDEVLIPVEASYLPIKGLQQLLKTIGKVRKQINPKLQVGGILFTMVDAHTNDARNNMELLRNVYGSQIHIFDNYIPFSVRMKEAVRETIADMGYLDEYETPLTPMEERGYYDEEGNLDIDAIEADGYEFGMDLAFGVLSVFDGKPERVLEIQKYVNEQYECCSNKKFMKVLETIARMNGNEEVYIEDMYACNKEARNYYLSELMMCFNFVFNEMCHGTGSVAGSDFNNEEE